MSRKDDNNQSRRVEDALNSVGKKLQQRVVDETLPGRQLGLYSKKIDNKEVRNMVNKLHPDKNSFSSRG